MPSACPPVGTLAAPDGRYARSYSWRGAGSPVGGIGGVGDLDRDVVDDSGQACRVVGVPDLEAVLRDENVGGPAEGYPAAVWMKGQPHSPAGEPPGRRSAVAPGAVRPAMSFAVTGSRIGVV